MARRVNYIDLGPAPVQASVQSATAPGRALASVGQAIEGTAQQAFQVLERVREVDEAGTRTSFMANLEQQSAEFKNSLLTRSDYKNWQPEYQQRIDGWKAQMDDLDLSPRGRAVLDNQFLKWSTDQNISMGTTANIRMVEEGRARVGNSLKYNTEIGNREGVMSDLAELPNLGYNSAQIEQVERDTMRQLDVTDLNRAIEENPDQFQEILPEQFPGMTPADLARAENRAKNLTQEYRSAEQQSLEDRLATGSLQQREIEQARYLTDKDKRAFESALLNLNPPDRETFSAAWSMTDTLREARNDPAVSQEAYREIFNETRMAVLESIPPNYQGDLKKELGYLSPAGRDPSNPQAQGEYTTEDLNSVARSQIQRSLDNGALGNIGDEATKQEKEAAYRRSEDIRLEAKRLIGSGKDWDAKKVREAVDSMISGNRTSNAAKSLQNKLPGMGGNLRGVSAAPFGQLPPEGDGMVLPPKPVEELNNYLDGNPR